jgi:phosphatidate phosphatase LPIN
VLTGPCWQAALGLKQGQNTITFSVTSRLHGTLEVTATVFLWQEDAKVVISDIDGTITRSDVLGHLLPMWGRDWSHVGVAQLLSDIKRQGYEVVYLTARAIGQARITRDYITRLRQGNASLPPGPIITTPDSLFAVRCWFFLCTV